MPEIIDQEIRWQPGGLVRVETDRFVITSLSQNDATETYISWWNDPEVQSGLNYNPRNWGVQQAREHIAKFDNKTSFHLGIFSKAERRFIGFFAIFWDTHKKIAKTNIIIGEKEFWGKGVVLEVRSRMLNFIFNNLGVVKVKGEVMGRNYPSFFNYKAQGFTCEGILRNEILHYKTGRTDMFIFGLLREEWLAATTDREPHA